MFRDFRLHNFVIAIKDLIHPFLVCFLILCECADQGNDDHGDGHGADAHFRRLCRSCGESGVQGDDQGRTAHGDQAGQNAGKGTGLRDLFGEQAPDVRSDEAAGNNAPGEGHQADDDGDVLRCEDEGAAHEGQAEQPGQEHLGILLDGLLSDGGDQVHRHCGSRGQDHSLEGRHGSGKQQDHDDGQEDQAKFAAAQDFHQQRGDHGIDAAFGKLTAQDQSGRGADQVGTAADNSTEEGGDDGAALDGCGILDGVELADHLGKAPGTEAGEHNVEAEEPERRTAEEIRQLAAGGGIGVTGQGLEVFQVFQQAADAAHSLMAQDRGHQQDHAHDHDDALYQVRVGGGNVAAGHQVNCGQDCNGHHPHPGLHTGEHHTKQRTQALVNSCGVGNQENEDDHRCQDFHTLGIVALFKVVGHGSGVQLLGHLSGAVGKQQPGQKAAQDGVADADPDGADADVPAMLTCVTNENNRREIGGAICEGRCPCADVSAADQEAVQSLGLAEADAADQDHDSRVDAKRYRCVNLWCCHCVSLP